jgi:preprotein translocase subunit SecA
MWLDKILAKIFGTANERELKRIRPLVDEISAKEPDIQRLSDDQLRAKTADSASALRMGRRSKTSCQRPLPSSVKRASAR